MSFGEKMAALFSEEQCMRFCEAMDAALDHRDLEDAHPLPKPAYRILLKQGFKPGKYERACLLHGDRATFCLLRRQGDPDWKPVLATITAQ